MADLHGTNMCATTPSRFRSWERQLEARIAHPIEFSMAVVALGLLLASGWVALSTGVSPDAAGYLGIAQQIIDHARIADPIGFLDQPIPNPALHWPPGYPLLLAASAAMGIPPLIGGRILALLAFTALLLLMASSLRRLQLGIVTAAVIVYFMINPAFLSKALSVSSNPVCAVASLAALVVATRAHEKGWLWAWGLAGLLAGSALSMRWTAAALVPALGLAALVWPASARARGLRVGLLVVGWLPTGGVALLWRLSVGDGPRLYLSEPMVDRGLELIRDAMLPFGVYDLASVCIAGALLSTVRPRQPEGWQRVALIHGVHLGASVCLLAYAKLTVEFDGLNFRTLAALLPSATLCLCALAAGIGRPHLRCPRARLAVVGAALLFMGCTYLYTTLNRRTIRFEHAERHRSRATQLAAMLPAYSEHPIITALPELAAYRPDLRWLRCENAPNGGFLAPATVVSRLHEAGVYHWVHLPGERIPHTLDSNCGGEICVSRVQIGQLR